MRTILVAIWLTIPAGDLAAADRPATWAAQMISAREAQRRGEFARAEGEYRSAIRLALENHPEEPVYEGMSANELGQLYFAEGQLAMSENLFLRALARFREIGDLAKQGRSAANLSTAYLEMGQFSKAEDTIRPYLGTLRGIERLDWAILSSNLGCVRAQQGREGEAEKLFRAVIDDLESMSDRDSKIMRAVAMDDLATLLAKTRRQAEGEALANRSLAILESSGGSLPANLIRAQTNVAEFKILVGDMEGAAALLERAIALYKSAFSTDQQLLGQVLSRYATVLRAKKKNAEARKIERMAARILSEFQRQNHLGYTVEANALK